MRERQEREVEGKEKYKRKLKEGKERKSRRSDAVLGKERKGKAAKVKKR